MAKEIKHYVGLQDYIDFLVYKTNQYEDIIKNLPEEDAMQKAQVNVLKQQLGLLKQEYYRAEYYSSLSDSPTSMIEITDNTAYSFFAYRLEKVKAGMNIQ